MMSFPSLSNLHCLTWSIHQHAPFTREKGPILSCCPKALQEGQYHWQHEQGLRTFAEIICSAITGGQNPLSKPSSSEPKRSHGQDPGQQQGFSTMHRIDSWQWIWEGNSDSLSTLPRQPSHLSHLTPLSQWLPQQSLESKVLASGARV